MRFHRTHEQHGRFEANRDALEAINALRANVIGTQSASWSNTLYPLVAILNSAGFEYVPPTEQQMREHMDCYGGAGGFPGHVLREPDPGWCEPVSRAQDALRLAEELISYSGLREKVRLRDDPTEYADAERLIARADRFATELGR